MTALDDATALFRDAGLSFPAIPPVLAVRLEQRDEWCYSTRELDQSPYDWTHYVSEADHPDLADHVVLAHAGHGLNSYAIHYYLVHGPLRLFLQLGWGGVYMDNEATTREIHHCFRLADQLDIAVHTSRQIPPGSWLTVAASGFYGSTWGCGGASSQLHRLHPLRSEMAVLEEVLEWVTGTPDPGA